MIKVFNVTEYEFRDNINHVSEYFCIPSNQHVCSKIYWINLLKIYHIHVIEYSIALKHVFLAGLYFNIHNECTWFYIVPKISNIYWIYSIILYCIKIHIYYIWTTYTTFIYINKSELKKHPIEKVPNSNLFSILIL